MATSDQDRAARDGAAEAVWEHARSMIDRLEGTSIRRLTVEAGNCRIEIERDVDAVAAPPATAVAAGGDGAPEAPDRGYPVVAPLVGRFYRAPKPGAEPFVKEGDVVEAAQTLCIVEAMKVMNEVTAGQAGRVLDVLVEDGEYVEFEQVLMYLEPLDG